MRIKKAIKHTRLATVILCPLLCSNAYALAVEKCEPALIQDVSKESLSFSEKLISYSLMDKKAYENAKQKGGIDIPGYASGDWDSFSRSINTIFSYSNSLTSRKGRVNYAKYYLSDNSTKAYLGCLDALTTTQYGLHAVFAKISGESAIVRLKWNPTPQVAADGSPITVIIRGTGADFSEYSNKKYEIPPSGEEVFIFTRTPGKEFNFVASGSGVVEVLDAPPHVTYTVEREAGSPVKRTVRAYCEYGGAECGDGGKPNKNGLCPVNVSPPDGYVFAQDPDWTVLELKDYGGKMQPRTQAQLISASPQRIRLEVQCYPGTDKGAVASGKITAKTFRWVVKEHK